MESDLSLTRFLPLIANEKDCPLYCNFAGLSLQINREIYISCGIYVAACIYLRFHQFPSGRSIEDLYDWLIQSLRDSSEEKIVPNVEAERFGETFYRFYALCHMWYDQTFRHFRLVWRIPIVGRWSSYIESEHEKRGRKNYHIFPTTEIESAPLSESESKIVQELTQLTKLCDDGFGIVMPNVCAYSDYCNYPQVKQLKLLSQDETHYSYQLPATSVQLFDTYRLLNTLFAKQNNTAWKIFRKEHFFVLSVKRDIWHIVQLLLFEHMVQIGCKTEICSELQPFASYAQVFTAIADERFKSLRAIGLQIVFSWLGFDINMNLFPREVDLHGFVTLLKKVCSDKMHLTLKSDKIELGYALSAFFAPFSYLRQLLPSALSTINSIVEFPAPYIGLRYPQLLNKFRLFRSQLGQTGAAEVILGNRGEILELFDLIKHELTPTWQSRNLLFALRIRPIDGQVNFVKLREPLAESDLRRRFARRPDPGDHATLNRLQMPPEISADACALDWSDRSYLLNFCFVAEQKNAENEQPDIAQLHPKIGAELLLAEPQFHFKIPLFVHSKIDRLALLPVATSREEFDARNFNDFYRCTLAIKMRP